MHKIVVPEEMFLHAAVLDAFDHRGMVQFVGEDDQAGQKLSQRRERRVVGDVAGGEQERRFLAVQVGEFALELHVIVRSAGDVAGAARTGARGVDRLVHGGEHLRMLAHAEIVVAAPDGNRPPVGVGIEVCPGIATTVADNVGEDAIPSFTPQPGKGVTQTALVRKGHDSSLLRRVSRPVIHVSHRLEP